MTAPGDADRSVHPWQPGEDHLDLYVDGVDLEGDPDVDTGDSCDTRTHTYRWTYVPTRTGRVAFAVWDPTTLADNSGALRIRVVALTPRDEMTWSLPATAAAGVTSPGALEAGGSYLLTVSGTVNAGGGVVSDAECSVTPSDPVWRRDRSVLAEDPTADHLDVLVDRDDVTFTPVNDPDGDGCDADTHTYRLTLRPRSTARGQPAGRRPGARRQLRGADRERRAGATGGRHRDGRPRHQQAGRRDDPELPGRPAAADHRDRAPGRTPPASRPTRSARRRPPTRPGGPPGRRCWSTAATWVT